MKVNAGIASLAFAAPPNGTDWLAGETISVTATFQRAVDVTGKPTLGLEIGDEVRRAEYSTGTGTKTLTFTYPVTTEDRDTDGIEVRADSLEGGTIAFVSPAQPVETGHAGLESTYGVRARPVVTDIALAAASDPGADQWHFFKDPASFP